MKVLLLYIVFFSLISCAGAKNSSETATLEVIRDNFESYKSSQKSVTGNQISDAVSAKTIAYFDHIMSLAVNADSVTVDKLDIRDKSYVLLARMIWNNDSLVLHNGKDLFTEITKRKLNYSPLVEKSEIAEIEMINDSSVKAYLGNDNKKLPVYFLFYKENNNWLIDPLTFSKAYFIPMDNVMILNYLKSQTKLNVPTDIWHARKK